MDKKSVEWDLNDWKWDADLLVATPLSSVQSDCRSRQFFPVGSDIYVNNGASKSFSSGLDGVVLENEREKGDLEKMVSEEPGSLNLKLGAQVHSFVEGEADEWEGRNGKKIKVSGAATSRTVCQVENCIADLSEGREYHRRHKVCSMHSKATRALVGNVMQRFCQQCSRFHVLEEFDEGKRSCRRRLAGHNKRRRKTRPENVVNAATLNDEGGSNYLLMSLLRILSNIHSNNSDPSQTKDHDLLSHILRNLANLSGTTDQRNPARLLHVSQELQCAGAETSEKEPTCHPGPAENIAASDLIQQRMLADNAQCDIMPNTFVSENGLPFMTKSNQTIEGNTSGTAIERNKMNGIDLNLVYDDSQDCAEDLQYHTVPENVQTMSPAGPLWLYKDSQRSSPPENSGNSGSTPNKSSSTSSGEEQSRTDRIVFKLFGKAPSDFPSVLRKQILEWLSNTPTNIESYIRPGCVVLTVYLQMDNSMWEELCCNLTSSLRRLLDSSTDSFWRTGWIYIRVQHHAAFIYDGQVVLDASLPLKHHQSCRISSIKPIAVSGSDYVQFSIKGFNFNRSSARILCTLDGKHLAHENCEGLSRGGVESFIDQDEIQALRISCAIPNIVGRGFIEVEDQFLSSSFYPFIVAEKDVCFEICSLESIIEVCNGDAETLKARNQALNFIHEMGWLLRGCLKFRLSETCPEADLFSFNRFRWLIEFSMDHDWCAVIKKLLSILFIGAVDIGQHNSILHALRDIGLLHQAIRRNCRSMVEFLLEYQPSEQPSSQTEPKKKQYLFKPNDLGHGGLTPLHIAACLDDRENVLDALTDDPESVGIEAWKNARDSAGLTPHDYACFRSHYSYIHLVQRKLNKKSGNRHTVVDIPETATTGKKKKTGNASKFSKLLVAFETESKIERARCCSECEPKLGWRAATLSRTSSSVRIYRPTMLSMVAIAAVCVCAALLFKSSPEVLFSFRPFRWELLKYGSE